MPTRARLCTKDEIHGAKRALVTVCRSSGESVDFVLVGGSGDESQYRCVEATCPHSGGPLHLGDIEDLGSDDPVIVCPWHSYRFSLVTGTSPQCEQHPALTLPVVLEDGQLYLELPEGDEPVGVKLFEVPKRARRPICTATPETAKETLSPPPTHSPVTLVDWAILILHTSDPAEKVRLTHLAADLWNSGQITEIGTGTPPPRPTRPSTLTTILPSRAKKPGKGGTLTSRILILHALGNVEQWAIDLAWDIIARFHSHKTPTGKPLPKEFFTDFVRVASEEAKHFGFLDTRLRELGTAYGTLPVHDGLWDSAVDTKESLLARLAIVHMIHEARGLDVNPSTITKFERAGDTASAEKLKIIHEDEITHVAAGQRWFTWIVSEMSPPASGTIPRGDDTTSTTEDRYTLFHSIVRAHFKGHLKPPFNDRDRLLAGLDKRFYLPLSTPVVRPTTMGMGGVGGEAGTA
ncbi:uncharacterized protein EV422DRAFT_618935 [Fimicolochytrium jonesii]|uniref:uncharacterized protein n=1 Tax=Fimicolochytrium jonesii TaxID=1396493 RepID=UPI0022FDE25C|nr:uncharacterized protein EV422DRAFT_618935 [Fimicolochytrium jonesii]KAI8822446.1 hypothetical protein EV422DRAFT_618935 [Fimicolochytrium jonesii]